MVEKWLTDEALAALRNAETGKVDENKVAYHDYNPELLDIQLPYTSHVERLTFIPPKIPQTISPEDFEPSDAKFNIFDHYSIEWINVPSLEGKE